MEGGLSMIDKNPINPTAGIINNNVSREMPENLPVNISINPNTPPPRSISIVNICIELVRYTLLRSDLLTIKTIAGMKDIPTTMAARGKKRPANVHAVNNINASIAPAMETTPADSIARQSVIRRRNRSNIATISRKSDNL